MCYKITLCYAQEGNKNKHCEFEEFECITYFSCNLKNDLGNLRHSRVCVISPSIAITMMNFLITIDIFKGFFPKPNCSIRCVVTGKPVNRGGYRPEIPVNYKFFSPKAINSIQKKRKKENRSLQVLINML